MPASRNPSLIEESIIDKMSSSLAANLQSCMGDSEGWSTSRGRSAEVKMRPVSFGVLLALGEVGILVGVLLACAGNVTVGSGGDGDGVGVAAGVQLASNITPISRMAVSEIERVIFDLPLY